MVWGTHRWGYSPHPCVRRESNRPLRMLEADGSLQTADGPLLRLSLEVEMASDVGVPANTGFGERVRRARTQRGMSREAAAALCGRSEEWLRQIERGRRGTSLKMVVRLADVLRVSDLTDLLGEDAPTALYA